MKITISKGNTLPHKDRLSVLDVLRNGCPRRLRLNQNALDCLANVPLSRATRQNLTNCCSELEMDETNFQKHLTWILPNLSKQQRKEIIDAAAIAAYWAETDWPVIETLLCNLFATQTGYEALDERIAKTRAKKTSLLLALKHPEIPLHNNASELGVRRRVRKRDVSFGPRTETGRHAWDTFMTLAETARKLDVSFYAYLRCSR